MAKNVSSMNSRIWLSSPHMSGNEQEFITDAFKSNWIAPLGPNVNGFENDLETYLNQNSHVAVLSSGTAAIHLALIVLGIKAGDEVICQSKTFIASVNPVVYLGAKPIFVDSEEETWNICPVLLEEAIKDRIKKGTKPKAIIAINLYGMPYNVTALNKISKSYDIPVIEDSAEALGSTYNGQKCGTFGEMSILSFNGNKIITTSGGGALVSRDPLVKDQTIFLATQAKDHGIDYSHTEIGYNYRMSNISAGVGRGQIQVIDAYVKLRRRNYDFYLKHLNNYKEINFLREPNGYFTNRWLTCILLETKKMRNDLISVLADYNIEARPSWKPMHLQPVFKGLPMYSNGIAENLYNKGLCLPSGSNLTDGDLTKIVTIIKGYFE